MDSARRGQHRHQQAFIKNSVSCVSGFIGEVELRGEHWSIWPLQLDVEMACAAWIEARHDSLQRVASLLVRKLVSTKLEAHVVIVALCVGVPEV